MPGWTTRSRVAASAVALGLGAAVAVWWAWPGNVSASPAPAEPVLPHAPAFRLADFGFWDQVNAMLAATPRPAAPVPPSPSRTRAPDKWSVANGRLIPGPALRALFDHYLGQEPAVEPPELRRRVQADATAAHGPTLAAEIAALWDGYQQLRSHTWSRPLKLAERETWQAYQDEQVMVRRRLLGTAWADAFFREEDRAMQWLLSPGEVPLMSEEQIALMHPQAAASDVQNALEIRRKRIETFGADMTSRLEQVEAEYADWQRRLAEAHAEWTRLQAAPGWTDTQRTDAMSIFIRTRFRDDEQMKARILLGLS